MLDFGEFNRSVHFILSNSSECVAYPFPDQTETETCSICTFVIKTDRRRETRQPYDLVAMFLCPKLTLLLARAYTLLPKGRRPETSQTQQVRKK